MNLMKEKFGNYLTNLVVLIVVVLVFFLILEGSLGVFKIGDVDKFKGWGFNPDCCGDLRPNQEIDAKVEPNHPYLIKTNSLGLRNNSDISLIQKKTRILAIGDSFTFGPYVSNEETWPAYLEEEFEKKAEVLNAGVAGYTIEEEFDYLKEKGVKLEPDLLILQFSPNDITDFDKPKERRGRGSALSNWGFIYKIFNFFRDKSRLFAAILEYQTENKMKKTRPIAEKAHEENKKITYYSNQKHPLFLKYEGVFEELVEFTRNHNLKLMVIAIPEVGQSEDLSLNDPDDFLEEMCRKNEIPFLDLQRIFYEKKAVGVLYLTPWNAHLSKHGNKLVAEEVKKFIVNNRVLEIEE